MLLLEVHHRIANSLQIISSILTMKMRSVQSEEARLLLWDMHRRLISVAIVQSQLCAPGLSVGIAFGPYLTKLCENLSISMIAEDSAVTVHGTKFESEAGPLEFTYYFVPGIGKVKQVISTKGKSAELALKEYQPAR